MYIIRTISLFYSRFFSIIIDYFSIIIDVGKKYHSNIIAPVTIVIEVAITCEGDQRSAADTE